MKALPIRAVQMFAILALAIGIKNHVIIVPLILNAAMRDAWISAILAIPLVLLWAAAVHKLMKLLNKESLYGWFSSRYNKLVACFVIMPLVLMLVMSLYITVRDSCTWTKVTYLPKTPFFVTVTLFVLASMAGAMKGLRTIAIASGLLLPGVILFGLFVMSVNFQFKDYSYLLPILTKGFNPVVRGTLYVLSGAVEMIIVLAFVPYIKGHMKLWSLCLGVIAITGLVFGPLIASIAIFGPYEASDQRYPAFEQWRMVLIGKFISHLDFLSIYQWLSGALIRISLAMFLVVDLLGLSSHKLKNVWLFALSAALIYSVAGIHMSDATFFSVLQNVYYPIMSVFFYAFPFLLLALAYLKRRSSAHATESRGN